MLAMSVVAKSSAAQAALVTDGRPKTLLPLRGTAAAVNLAC